VQFQSTRLKSLISILKRTKECWDKAEQRLQTETLRQVSAAVSAIPERQQKLWVNPFSTWRLHVA